MQISMFGPHNLQPTHHLAMLVPHVAACAQVKWLDNASPFDPNDRFWTDGLQVRPVCFEFLFARVSKDCVSMAHLSPILTHYVSSHCSCGAHPPTHQPPRSHHHHWRPQCNAHGR